MSRPGPLFYGWVLVLTLGVTETVSYGILSYAFPVFLAPMGAELGWSRTALTGAFSLAALVAGAAAIPVGRMVDRHGARGVMTAGSVLATLLLLAWAGVDRLWAFYAIWAGLGLASAAVLYEPAFAVLATWFDRRRGRAITILTFMAGFASVIFVPFSTWLVDLGGWRSALVWLAVVLGVLTILPHALLLRRRPADLGLRPDGVGGLESVEPPESVERPGWVGVDRGQGLPVRSVPASVAVRSRSFRRLTLSFCFGYLVLTGLGVHFIPLLLERGYDATFAGAALGAVGLLALPGRLVFTPLGGRWPRPAVTASIYAFQALGVVALLATDRVWGVWAFVLFFGAGFGAVTPARAALVAEFYGPAQYGRISGTMALFIALSRAAGPVGLSLLYVLVGGYDGVLAILLAVSIMAGIAVLAAGSDDGPPVPARVPRTAAGGTLRCPLEVRGRFPAAPVLSATSPLRRFSPRRPMRTE